MKAVFNALLRVLYILSKPVSGVVLHDSHRVRVLVVHQDELLLIRSSFGHQDWSLPGGGIERGETEQLAASRELSEETGIKISPQSMKIVDKVRLPRDKKWPVINATFLMVKTSKKLQPTLSRPFEIMEAGWFPLTALPEKRSGTVDEGLRLANLAVV